MVRNFYFHAYGHVGVRFDSDHAPRNAAPADLPRWSRVKLKYMTVARRRGVGIIFFVILLATRWIICRPTVTPRRIVKIHIIAGTNLEISIGHKSSQIILYDKSCFSFSYIICRFRAYYSVMIVEAHGIIDHGPNPQA